MAWSTNKAKKKKKILKQKKNLNIAACEVGVALGNWDSPGETQYKCPGVNKAPECPLNTQNVPNNSCLTIPFVLGVFLKVRLRSR